jgi:hypothetical protein
MVAVNVVQLLPSLPLLHKNDYPDSHHAIDYKAKSLPITDDKLQTNKILLNAVP